MKTIIILWIIGIISISILYGYLNYMKSLDDYETLNTNIQNDINFAYEKIIKQIKIYPQPYWSLKYYSFDWKTKNSNEQYDIVSWLLCWKKFKDLWINWIEPLNNKCYSYSTTKDWKYFEIWWVLKFDENTFKTVLKWNSKKNLTKDYIEEKIISNWDTKKFPYSPYTKYISAKISDLKIWEWWKIYVIDEYWKNISINNSNFQDYILKPWTKILLKWNNSFTQIKFENNDILELSWDTILKLKENEILNDGSINNNIFWLIWKITYKTYWDNSWEISNPVTTLAIKWNILEWFSKIDKNKFFIETKDSSQKSFDKKNYDIKQNKIDSIQTNNNFQGDILWWNNIFFDIENLLIIEK